MKRSERKFLPMLKRLVLLASALGLGACKLPTKTEANWPAPERRYVGVSFGASAANMAGDFENRVDALTSDAPELLSPGQRIAFYPPDSCRQTTAAPERSREFELLSMTCGVLMSSLETTAARAGYEVVSWQLLKDKGALEAAKSFEIDVLLEVDQFVVSDRSAAKVSATNLGFFVQSSADDRTPLAVTQETALQCKGLIDSLIGQAIHGVTDLEDSATLAVKAVDVKSGRAIVYYQKTLQLEGEKASGEVRLYFALDGTRPEYVAPQPTLNAMQRVGGLVLTLGLAGAAVGTGFTAVRRYPEANTGVGILTSSLLVAGAGATLLALGNRKAMKADSAPPPPPAVYPGPESQLCRTSRVTPPWEEMAAPQPSQPEKQYNYDFKDKVDSPTDSERRRREKLSRMAADDFVTALKTLVGNRPGPRSAP